MGWLRDLMRARVPPLRSFDALAREALQSSDWPTDIRVQPRSLAALLGKLDRDQALEWLRDREPIQKVLAQVLRRPLADLRATGQDEAGASANQGWRLRLDDVPYARALDLKNEPLCPGLPAAVLEPAVWDRLWWVAPSGSGKSLAGSWLEARALATFVRVETGHALELGRLARGAIYVELGRGPAPQADSIPGQRLCVAAPFDPGPGWTVVKSAPISEAAGEIVHWLAPRLPADGRFDPERMLAWLNSGVLEEGWIDGLGALLGVCGAIDELGLSRVERLSARELGRRFFLHRVAQLEQGGQSDGAWLRRHGLEMLRGLVRRCLTDAETSSDTPRPLDGWMELVPLEYQRDVDLEWLRLSLGEDRIGLRSADLERAARRLPPGAYRIVRGLRAAGLLRAAAEPGHSRLGPRWLFRWLEREAYADLGRASPAEWGEALLRTHAAAGVMDQLWTRAQREDAGLIDDVVELEADHEPAHVAALEAVFTVVGLAVLQGADFPSELLEALFSEQLRLVVDLPGQLPRPRLLPVELVGANLFAHGSWLLAALAISEDLPSQSPARHVLLRPWTTSAPPALLGLLFDRVLVTLVAGNPPPWSCAALGLVDRLRAVVGRAGSDWHPLERPGVLLEEFEHEVLSWDTLAGLEGQGSLFESMVRCAAAKGHPWPAVAQAMWRAWRRSGIELEAAALLGRDTPWASQLWPHMPIDILLGLVDQYPEQVAFTYLSDHQWIGLIDSPRRELPDRALRLWWQAVPERLLARASAAHPLNGPEPAAVLWNRAPDSAASLFAEAWRARDWMTALSLMQGAPWAYLPQLVATGESEPSGNVPDQCLTGVRAWLVRAVALRVPQWRRAYAWLARLEQDWARAESASFGGIALGQSQADPDGAPGGSASRP